MSFMYIKDCGVYCQCCMEYALESGEFVRNDSEQIFDALDEEQEDEWKEYQDNNAYYGNYVADGFHSFVCDNCGQRCCYVDTCSDCEWEEEIHVFFDGEEPSKEDIKILERNGIEAHYVTAFWHHGDGIWDLKNQIDKLKNRLWNANTDIDEDTITMASLR